MKSGALTDVSVKNVVPLHNLVGRYQ